RNTAPRNLANAFETPIRARKDESLTKKSAEELAKKAKTLQAVFGGKEKTMVLNPIGATLNGFGKPAATLNELLDDTLSAVKE
ncbi:MAG: type I-E CRISPR-associated protein Cas7/Cse4/CasC, partial [Terriglobia bacterium]